MGRHGAELVVGQFDGDVEHPAVPDVDHRALRDAVGTDAPWTRSDEQLRDRRDRPLCGRQPDPDGAIATGQLGDRHGEIRQRLLLGRPALVGLDDGIEAFEAESEVRSALVASKGVDLVDDHGANCPEQLAAADGRQQQVQRLRRRYDDLGPVADHGSAVGLRGVAVANGHAHVRHGVPQLAGHLGDLRQRPLEVLGHVDGERTQRRHVDDVGAPPALSPSGSLVATVDRDEEGGERLSGSGRRGDERVPARCHCAPPESLGLRRPTRVRTPKPLRHRRMEPRERVRLLQNWLRSGGPCHSGSIPELMFGCTAWAHMRSELPASNLWS
jgi:hypothetical protein